MILKLYRTTSQEISQKQQLLRSLAFARLEKAPDSKLEGFLATRQALLLALQEEGHECDLTELEIIDYSYLEKIPTVCLSLSHCQNVGAALVAQKKLTPNVGVDIEPLERQVPSGSQKHFVNKLDDLTIPLLYLWSMKEAAFKALDPLKGKLGLNPSLFLKDIWIKQSPPGMIKWGLVERSSTDAIGEGLWETQSLENQNFLISKAWVLPTSLTL